MKQPPSRLPAHALFLYRDAWGQSHTVAAEQMSVFETDDPTGCVVSFKAGLDLDVTIRGQKAQEVIEMMRAAADAPDDGDGPIPLMRLEV